MDENSVRFGNLGRTVENATEDTIYLNLPEPKSTSPSKVSIPNETSGRKENKCLKRALVATSVTMFAGLVLMATLFLYDKHRMRFTLEANEETIRHQRNETEYLTKEILSIKTRMTLLNPAWILVQYHNFADDVASKGKKWLDYKNGFSEWPNEYWLGLEKIHEYTASGSWVLKVQIKYDLLHDGTRSPRNGSWGVGEWDKFAVASENEKFKLSVGNPIRNESLDGEDVFSYHDGMKFTTIDNDNDMKSVGNCAEQYGGGWWYNSCYHVCLNCARAKATWDTEKLAQSLMWMKKIA